ncbi:hypothetical protein J2T13_004105 [Paenibacillus sp. DS2015]|uniref:YcdB/YcdC domain-containing protein n=1 Tax=Paenibacillus sp. DS2015 TaxID=3373917 RepID=UPI003D225CBE
MSVDIENLRTRAKTIVEIPAHYRLEMEDNIPKGDEQERCFIWEDPENEDNRIEVTLDLYTGHVTRLAIDRAEEEEINEVGGGQWMSSDGKARVIADTFVARHTPDAAELTSVFIEKERDGITFTLRREVGGLPLPGTGCKLTIDAGLNVVRYRLDGRKNLNGSLPEWPAAIVDEETVKEYVRRHLRMELTIVSLYPSMYELNGNEPEYRLAYMPTPEHQFIDAITGLDLFSPEHYVMPPSSPVPQIKTVSNLTNEDEKGSWEQRLGINVEHYMLEKTLDDGETVRYRYQISQQEEEEPETDGMSVDAYMNRKWGDQLRNMRDHSIMVQLEKKTGRLIGFHQMNCGEVGVPTFSRELCWKQAEQFLGIVFPDYAQYLQLEIDQANSDEEPCKREFFYLPVFIDGIPVNHERITISVCTSTGEICAYMGVSYELISELTGRQFQSIIMAETALDSYVEQMKLRLKWYEDQDKDDHDHDHDHNTQVYRLLYEATTKSIPKQGNEGKLRYIDAMTGEFIWGK